MMAAPVPAFVRVRTSLEATRGGDAASSHSNHWRLTPIHHLMRMVFYLCHIASGIPHYRSPITGHAMRRNVINTSSYLVISLKTPPSKLYSLPAATKMSDEEYEPVSHTQAHPISRKLTTSQIRDHPLWRQLSKPLAQQFLHKQPRLPHPQQHLHQKPLHKQLQLQHQCHMR